MQANNRTLFAGLAALVLVVFTPSLALAQGAAEVKENILLNSTEVFLGLCAAAMAFATAQVLRGGRLGKGMTWVAVGMVIMAIGHLILVVRRVGKFDPLAFLGETGSVIGFFLAVFCSFSASIFGFWLMRRAGRP